MIFIIGNKISLSKRAFTFSLVDKLFLFTFFILVYTLIPLEMQICFQKYHIKNLLIIPITYCIGRNITFENRFFNKIIRIFYWLLPFIAIFRIFDINSFHGTTEYSNYNLVVNEIDPQGNYGLLFFESQESSPRYSLYWSIRVFSITYFVFFIHIILFSYQF